MLSPGIDSKAGEKSNPGVTPAKQRSLRSEGVRLVKLPVCRQEVFLSCGAISPKYNRDPGRKENRGLELCGVTPAQGGERPPPLRPAILSALRGSVGVLRPGQGRERVVRGVLDEVVDPDLHQLAQGDQEIQRELVLARLPAGGPPPG